MNRSLSPDYFAPSATSLEAILRRIKGTTRRAWILAALERGETLESVPEDWKRHDLPAYLKALLQQQHPRYRGGEDLPDLAEGEVEIARITLTDSVHGEVTSFRARPSAEGYAALSLVDEWETTYELPYGVVQSSLTAEQVLLVLESADPSPLAGSCQMRLDSHFYQDLDELADRLNLKQVTAFE